MTSVTHAADIVTFPASSESTPDEQQLGAFGLLDEVAFADDGFDVAMWVTLAGIGLVLEPEGENARLALPKPGRTAGYGWWVRSAA